MDNFNYKKFLAEGKLYEETEALDRESVIDMAQMVADEFTKEDASGDEFSTYMIYKVGEVDGLNFELDTEATEKTPERDAKYGTGEGWGGIFRIKVLPNGYEIRNVEKGGLVATMDMEDGFKMLSADESRAEMGLEEGEMLDEGIIDKIKDKIVAKVDKIKSKFSDEEIAKMKAVAEKAIGKSAEDVTMADFTIDNIKKVGKAISALNEEEQIEEGLGEKIQGLGAGLGLPAMFVGGHMAMASAAGGVEAFIAGAIALVVGLLGGAIIKSMKENKENKPSNKMKKSELKEMIKMAMLEDARTDAEQEGYKDGFEDAKEDVEDALKKMKVSEAEEEDVDVEKDVNVDVDDTEDVDVDIEKDVKVDDEETEADIDVKASVSGESEEVEAVQGLLTKALEMSQALGDEKLEDQIGNTITYFTRAHVSRVNEMDVDSVSTNIDDVAAAEIGLDEAKDEEVKENLNESVVFPMWNKIK